MKRLSIAVNRLIHDQGALAINNMATLIILVTAQRMRVLHDDGVGSHLDHEPAGITDTGRRNLEFSRSMQQHDEVIEILSSAIYVSDKVNRVQRSCAP